MKTGVLVYNIKNNLWQYNDEKFKTFFDGLISLSIRFDTIGWCYFSDDYKLLTEYILKNKTDDLPEMKTIGSNLFLENTEYLEASNVYFNSFSIINKSSFDTWRSRSNAGFITSSIIKNLNNYNFPKSYKVTLAVLSYAAYKIGAFVSVFYDKKFNERLINGLSDKEYIEFISYTKKKKWILYYLISRLIFDKKIIFPLKYLFLKKYQNFQYQQEIWGEIFNQKKDLTSKTIDAFIPTLGRPDFVYQTIKDLHNQGYKINKFYIIEQKLPNQKETLLEKTLSKKWNFEIEHILLDKLGLCNARNLGFQKSKADYIIMFDDDIRIHNQPNLLENLITKLEITNSQIISFGTNNIKGNILSQMSYSVAGCSSLFKNKNILPFNIQIEGFGADDQDYNFFVHHKLQRIIFTNEEFINHLSAPMGGWRFDAKKYLPWYKDSDIEPLPGPVTI